MSFVIQRIPAIVRLHRVPVPHTNEATYVLDGAGQRWVAKREADMGCEALLAEALTWLLARQVGVPVPDAAFCDDRTSAHGSLPGCPTRSTGRRVWSGRFATRRRRPQSSPWTRWSSMKPGMAVTCCWCPRRMEVRAWWRSMRMKPESGIRPIWRRPGWWLRSPTSWLGAFPRAIGGSMRWRRPSVSLGCRRRRLTRWSLRPAMWPGSLRRPQCPLC
jgi:hypothetical protein